ncbi:uncharacterized protein [Diadema setosum]|uniref:uncharacterized protein n=1 Tax=Diadema setosum TaxID=31175 RepID=UPI003B3B8EF1
MTPVKSAHVCVNVWDLFQDSGHLGEQTTAALLAVSIGSLVCIILAVFGCVCCCGKTSILKYEESVEYDDGHANGRSNDAFADFSPPTQSTPSVPPGGITETVSIEQLPDLSRLQGVTTHGVPQVGSSKADANSNQGELKHLNSPRFVFPRDQLNYVDELGNGWFGKVLQGEAHRLHQGMRKTRVVIKQLRDTASPEEQLLFLQEVQPYREVNHPNVLMLLGQCIETIPLLLVLEYAPYGDLKSYLRKNRGSIDDLAQKDIQLRMAHDIISGLLWLHQADFIHIDLAARNCQVCADTSVKIGDYGLALEQYSEDYYITRDGRHAVPIRWLSPEVIEVAGEDIRPKKITKASNVWSFGVMMLELSTCGDQPYPDLSDEQVLRQVVVEQQIKLDKPSLKIKYANRWFEIMMFCWLDCDARPTVKEVHELLSHLKKNVDRVDMEDFETRWNALKPAMANQSSSECSEASQDAQRLEEAGQGVVGVTLDPISAGGPQQDPLSVMGGDLPPEQSIQVVSVDVTLPSFGDNEPEDAAKSDPLMMPASEEPSEASLLSDKIVTSAAMDLQQQVPVMDEVVVSKTTPVIHAEPPLLGNESVEIGFGDALDTEMPKGEMQLSIDSMEHDTSAEASSKTPEFFSSTEDHLLVSASTPFASSQTAGDTSSSSDAYNTALSSMLDSGDNTVTFTESFNTKSSNPFSAAESSDPGVFASAVESAGDASNQDSPDFANSNGFGEFESSDLSFGLTSGEDSSTVKETPTPGAKIEYGDLLGDFSQSSSTLFNTPTNQPSDTSISFNIDVETPAVAETSNDVFAPNDSPIKEQSLQSFGAITLEEQKLDPTPTPVSPDHEALPQGYAEVNTAAKKPFGMTMLTVSSGKKKKSIEIHKDEEDEDEEGGHSSASQVAVTTEGLESSKVILDSGDLMASAASGDAGANLLDFEVPSMGPGLTSGFGDIEFEVSGDGQNAHVVQSVSTDSSILDEL